MKMKLKKEEHLFAQQLRVHLHQEVELTTKILISKILK